MHILVANNIYPPIQAGGAELIVSYLCEELVARGNRVTVVSTCGPEMEPHPIENRNGVEVIRFFPKNRYWSFARGRQAGVRTERTRLDRVRAGVDTARWHLTDAWNRDAARRLGAVLASARPDLLHSHVIDGMSASMWGQARQRGMPVVHTAHDYHLLCPRAFLLSKSWKICTQPMLACQAYRAWHIRTTAQVDLFTSPSRFLLDLHKQAGLRSAASMVLANGIPLSPVARPPYSARRARLLLLTRLTVEKGVRVVLDAMAALPADFPAELVIAGRGPLEPEVVAAAARDPRIRFLGYVQGEAKAEALAWADHLLLPSLWYENAPVVILEAAAHGLSLIASRIGGIPEFVREGRTGRLFQAGDPAALAEAILAAAADTAMLDGLAAEGRSLIADYTVDRMVDGFTEQYRQLVPQRALVAA
jgi:glycosyltransferase involved in cell wall biosynthesis